MIVATLLVIPDLILEEQPLRASWHRVAVIGDWVTDAARAIAIVLMPTGIGVSRY
jgi:hypothetical protein